MMRKNSLTKQIQDEQKKEQKLATGDTLERPTSKKLHDDIPKK
jgi:hypothetical protein